MLCQWKHFKKISIIWLYCLLCMLPYQTGCSIDINEQTEKAKEIYRQTQIQDREKMTEVVYTPKKEQDVETSRGEFFISNVHLQGERRFYFLQSLLSSYENRRISADDLRTLIKRSNERLVTEGYVTTRVIILPQNIQKGTLVVTVVPGKIHHFVCGENSVPVHWETAFPTKTGDILNIHDLEQGLENLRNAYGQNVRI